MTTIRIGEEHLAQRIYVLFGMACNLKCRYCIQPGSTPSITKGLSPSVATFIHRCCDEWQKSGRVGQVRVILFGGEPLLYWPQVMELVQVLATRDIDWKLFTNGKLLDLEKIDFCNRYHVRIAVSNDGPESTNTRGYDFFQREDATTLLRAMRRKHVACTVTKYSQDLYKNVEYWSEIAGEPMSLKFNFLNLKHPVPDDLLDYDFQAWAGTCERMLKRAKEQLATGHIEWEAQTYLGYARKYQARSEDNFFAPECNAYKSAVNIDAQGHIYLCQHGVLEFEKSPKPFSELSQSGLALFQSLYAANRQDCLQCRYRLLCETPCPLIVPTEQVAKQCEFEKIFYESVFKILPTIVGKPPQRETTLRFSSPLSL